MKKYITTLLATLALVGCAGNSAQTGNTANADRSDLVCVSEKPTGSNIAKRVCRTPAQMELERARAEQATDKLRRTGSAGEGQGQ